MLHVSKWHSSDLTCQLRKCPLTARPGLEPEVRFQHIRRGSGPAESHPLQPIPFRIWNDGFGERTYRSPRIMSASCIPDIRLNAETRRPPTHSQKRNGSLGVAARQRPPSPRFADLLLVTGPVTTLCTSRCAAPMRPCPSRAGSWRSELAPSRAAPLPGLYLRQRLRDEFNLAA